MIKFLKNRFLLSDKGARNMVQGIIWSALLNLTRIFPFGLAIAFIVESVEIYLLGTKTSYGLSKYIIGLVLICTLQYLVHYRQYNTVYYNTYTESTRIRVDLAQRLRTLPLSFFEKRDLSDLTATILGDITIIEEAYSHSLPQFFGSFLSVSLIFLSYLVFNPRLALAMYWPVLVCALIIILAKKSLGKNEWDHSQQKRIVADRIQEGLDNILDIKAYKIKDEVREDFGHQLEKEHRAHTKSEAGMGALMAPLNGILSLGALSSIYVGVKDFQAGHMDLTSLVPLLIISFVVYQPIRAILPSLMQIIMVEIPIRRMKDIMEIEVMDGDKPQIESFDLTFEDLSFAYDGHNYVLKDINLMAKQGQVTALVGPSGSGKSSLARLAIRFWDPNQGQVKLGGQDISKIDPEYLYGFYSIVFQEVTLFNNTVMENVRIGNVDATDEEVIQACKTAMAHDFIIDLPQGYNTMIGEDGASLSGGQRQRLSIARAILKDAPIIILDEASASMDAINESKFQTALSNLIKDKTVITIAHRLRTVAKADKIVVLDEGKIVEEGDFDKLMAKEGLFHRLWTKQNKDR